MKKEIENMKPNAFYKTIISLVLAAIVMSACASPTPVAQPAEATEVAAKPDEITLWSRNSQGDVKDWNTDPILGQIEKATNTNITVSHYDWGTYTDQVSAAASTNDLPGIVGVVEHDKVTLLYSMAENGVIAPFEGDVAAAAPNVIALYEANPVLSELKVDGKIYFVPVSWGDGTYPNMGLFHVRQDLLDKYGMKAPNTFDEYFAFLKTCKEQGDGSGVIFSAKDTGINQVLSGFSGAYGLPALGWVKTDNGYEFWAVQPGTKDALMLFRQMLPYADPASWSASGNDARAIYVAGQACSYIFNGGGHIGRIQNDMALVNPDFKELLLPALDAGTGKRGYTAEPMFWGVVSLGASNQENPVAAARVVNYLISPEGYKLTAVGIEGQSYTEEDGKITLNEQRGEYGFPSAAGDVGFHPASVFVSWVPQDWQNWQLQYGKDQAYVDWFNQMWENQGMYQTPLSYGMVATSPKWTDFQATSSDLLTRSFVEIVRAPDDKTAGELFDKFVQKWLSSGGADATAEMSAKLAEMYK
jgi:putative aldouronate transport system substrate-binding protein